MELASLAALERTHRQHDQVVAELLDAARRFAAGRPDAGDLARVRDAVVYFEDTVTRHFVDEDGSVFPRLSTRRPELAAALAELSAEHPTQITLQAEVASAAHELDSEARPSAGKTLLDAATRLAEVHHAHVGREDEIFATAHSALTAQDDREIVAEMEMRRDRTSAREPSAAPAKPRRAAGATTKLTTKRASVAGRSSAKRAPAPPAPAAKKSPAMKPAKAPASKPTKAPATKPAKAPTKTPATKPASKPTTKSTPTPARRAARPGARR